MHSHYSMTHFVQDLYGLDEDKINVTWISYENIIEKVLLLEHWLNYLQTRVVLYESHFP